MPVLAKSKTEPAEPGSMSGMIRRSAALRPSGSALGLSRAYFSKKLNQKQAKSYRLNIMPGNQRMIWGKYAISTRANI